MKLNLIESNGANFAQIGQINIERETLASIAADSIVKLELANVKDKKRWITAIAKAVKTIESTEILTFNADEKSLNVRSSRGKAVYRSNGVCQCEAFEKGMPCVHRAMSRLLLRYIETVH